MLFNFNHLYLDFLYKNNADMPAKVLMLLLMAGAGIYASLLSTQLSANELVKGTSQTITVHKQGEKSQQRIDRVDEVIKTSVQTYLNNERVADVTEAYNHQVRQLLQAQEQEITDLQVQIASLEETDRAVLPLLKPMLKTLAAFVANDTPFLLHERRQRVERLRKLLQRADVSVAEKYRQMFEAYAVEVQYGHTLEAYSGQLETQDNRQVVFLRLGRAALYFQSLKGDEGYLWQPATHSWQKLAASQNQVLGQAIRIARQQRVPELLNMPLPRPKTTGLKLSTLTPAVSMY